MPEVGRSVSGSAVHRYGSPEDMLENPPNPLMIVNEVDDIKGVGVREREMFAPTGVQGGVGVLISVTESRIPYGAGL